MNIFESLKVLTDIPGISGQEDLVRDEIIKKIHGKCEYHTDPLGNIIVFKKGHKIPKNKLLFSAHMDEIGFVVTSIHENGMLHFATVGGVDTRVIFGKPVLIGKNQVHGVIGGNPVHQLTKSEELKPAEMDKMLIDIGATSKEEALEHVCLGDGVVYNSPLAKLGEDTIIGKALDDRAGCFMLLEMILADLEYDCHFSFTVQEEVGCIGGTTAAYSINPDIGIAVESTTASDIGGVSTDSQVCRQGYGPVVSFMDKGTLYPQDLFNFVLDTAKKHNIPCQTKEGVFGGNEARSLQTARGGAKVVAVSLPTRYIHSPSSTVRMVDIENTVALLKILAKELAEV